MLKSFSVCGCRNFAREVSVDFSDTRDYQFNAQAVSDGLVAYNDRILRKTRRKAAL